jgi:predicted alpha/beta hydrolase family esterase
MRLVIAPGIDNSGPEHWQTRWEGLPGADCVRFAPSSWEEPEASDWVEALRTAVAAAGPDCVVVAHSLGCWAAAHLAVTTGGMRGVVLVAPPDITAPTFPAAARGFDRLPRTPVRLPGLLVTSDDDSYATPEANVAMAAAWGVPHVSVGALGHLNAASGLGPWDEGRRLVTAFGAGLGLS